MSTIRFWATQLIAFSIIATLAFPLIASASAETMTLNYDVSRKGSIIGTHKVSFDPSGDRLTVRIHTDVAVKIAFITAYRFKHDATEIWENGTLINYQSVSDDDGKNKNLALSGKNGTYTVDGSAGRYETQSIALPASLWHTDTVTQSLLLNTLDGHVMKVTITDEGMQTILAGGQQLNAQHYVMTGDLERELWYANGQLVHLRFKGGDGSTIDYNLR